MTNSNYDCNSNLWNASQRPWLGNVLAAWVINIPIDLVNVTIFAAEFLCNLWKHFYSYRSQTLYKSLTGRHPEEICCQVESLPYNNYRLSLLIETED